MEPDLEHFEEYDAATAEYSFGFEILIDRNTNEFVSRLIGHSPALPRPGDNNTMRFVVEQEEYRSQDKVAVIKWAQKRIVEIDGTIERWVLIHTYRDE